MLNPSDRIQVLCSSIKSLQFSSPLVIILKKKLKLYLKIFVIEYIF